MAETALVRKRPRILVVDDQRDVARTLSKLLNPLNAEVRFADDGETGLQKLRDEIFDLALIDLAMPPDGAGGLWLLRMLAEHRIGTPTVVLSGQGGQDDTIEAQRLGTKAYVVKHKAADELLDIVSEVLVEAYDTHWNVATTRLPAPVAIPLIQSRLQADPVHRLHDSINCVESIFRFTALSAVASDRGLLADFIKRPPAMGAWQSLCRQLQSITTAVPAAWFATVLDRSANDLIAVRNDDAHGAVSTATWAQEQQYLFDEWLAFFLAAATTRPAPRTVVADRLEDTGDGFVVDVADLAGSATMVRGEKLSVGVTLRKGHVYLVEEEQKPIDLWPLIVSSSTERFGQWTVCVLDSVSPKGQLRYINLTTGRRETSANTTADLTTTI